MMVTIKVDSRVAQDTLGDQDILETEEAQVKGTLEEVQALLKAMKEEQAETKTKDDDDVDGRLGGKAYSGYSCTVMPKSTDMVLFCDDWTKIALM
ncbi:hypothetical protein BGX24_004280 [Mortierella sp. AD032]|nr:hypothetical protein BGX24_004280 [Mortierella sp. AD032]